MTEATLTAAFCISDDMRRTSQIKIIAIAAFTMFTVVASMWSAATVDAGADTETAATGYKTWRVVKDSFEVRNFAAGG